MTELSQLSMLRILYGVDVWDSWQLLDCVWFLDVYMMQNSSNANLDSDMSRSSLLAVLLGDYRWVSILLAQGTWSPSGLACSLFFRLGLRGAPSFIHGYQTYASSAVNK